MNHHKQQNAAQFINELHQLVDAHLQQAISIYQNLTEHQLNRPAADGGWSIAQCLEHLNSYGHHYLPRIQQAMTQHEGEQSTTAIRGWLGNYFIKMMDPDLKPTRYKAIKAHIPSNSLRAHQVVAEFIRQQELLIKLLATAALKDLNSIRVTTSISKLINLKLGDTFAFLIIHNERHIRQANLVGSVQ